MMDNRKFRRKPKADPVVTPSRETDEEIQARLDAERETELRRIALERIAARKAEQERKARLAEAEMEAEAREEAQRAEAEELAAEQEQERLAEEQRHAEKAELEAKAQAEAERRIEAAKRAEMREAERRAEAEALRLQDAPNLDLEPEQHAPENPQPPAAPPTIQAPQKSHDAWDRISSFTADISHLSRNRIITAEREDPAHIAFDVLRTRLLQALSDNGWNRVAITSPTKDCGKTFTAANLSISLSRQENIRTLLLDCDMRRPSLHSVMGITEPGSMGDMLRGRIPPEQHLRRLGDIPFNEGGNIAFGFSGVIEPNASELLQDPRTAKTLDAIEEQFEPDVMLFDLPPALYYDDVIAARPLFDGVLLIIGGGTTTEKEVKEVERRLGDSTPLLGMVLNKAENTEISRYRY